MSTANVRTAETLGAGPLWLLGLCELCVVIRYVCRRVRERDALFRGSCAGPKIEA